MEPGHWRDWRTTGTHVPTTPLTVPFSQGMPTKQQCKETGKRSCGQQMFLNLFVCVWTPQNAAACSSVDYPSPGFLWIVEGGALQRSLMSATWHRVFCHSAVTISSLSHWPRVKACFTGMLHCWMWKCRQHPPMWWSSPSMPGWWWLLLVHGHSLSAAHLWWLSTGCWWQNTEGYAPVSGLGKGIEQCKCLQYTPLWGADRALNPY